MIQGEPQLHRRLRVTMELAAGGWQLAVGTESAVFGALGAQLTTNRREGRGP